MIQVNFFNEWNQGLDNLKDIRKIKLQIIFLSDGLIMGAVCLLPLWVNPFKFCDEPDMAKTRLIDQSVIEDIVILACVFCTTPAYD